jgi:ATP-dependent helicase HrpA
VLAAQDNGCVREVLVIAAGLSIQDPRERPVDQQAQATQAHARFVDPDSDFLAYLNLWKYLQEQQKALSGNQFRRLCRAEFLNYLRVREWQDLHSQLRQVARGLGVAPSTVASEPDRIHQSLLAGLLSHVGLKDPTQSRGEYLGARNAKFAVFPGSALFKKQPRWVMAAELVETSRLWARICARIEPEWVEALAGHLVKRSYSEPHWEKKQGAVVGYERVTLYGVPLVAQRKVNFGRIDPALSRELFIRHALVEGDWTTHHQFFHDNRRLLDEVEQLEHRVRRRDIVVDDQALYDFYDARLPADVVSGRHFDAWWKRARRDQPDLLTFDRAMLVTAAAGGVSPGDYPDWWERDGTRLRLTYQFEPGTAADGVTAHVPVAVLGQLSGEGLDWQVPGLREELVTALIRSLPKSVRREFVPVPDYARAFLDLAGPDRGPLLSTLERELLRMTGVPVPHDAWDVTKVPEHLRMTFRVEDEHGAALAEGKNLAALRERLRDTTRAALSASAGDVERHGLREFPADGVPREFARVRGGLTIRGYPALVDEGATVGVRLFDSETEARQAMRAGTRRLLALGAPAPIRIVDAGGGPAGQGGGKGTALSYQDKLALGRNPHGGVAALLDDCTGAAIDHLVADAGGPAWDADGFAKLRDTVRAGLPGALRAVVAEVRQVLAGWYELDQLLATGTADMREHLTRLVHPGFVTETGWDHLGDLPRYLRALRRRLEKLPENPRRDEELTVRVREIEAEYRDLAASVPASPELDRVRWMIEELRVNYFAQAIGTPYPISDKRIYRAMDELG